MVLEDKLAEPARNQPLALTLGAAAVTLVVIIGVLTGPTVVSCFNSDSNMGLCLRDRMTDAGILSRPATSSTQSEASAPSEPAAIVVEPPAAAPVASPAAPETAVTPAAPAAASGDAIVAATFGLLRAQPDGSVVIAGSGTPGSEVEVFSNGDLLGSTTVESSGDWVLVPEQPIAPGGTELTLGEAGKEGQSSQSFVVVINPDKRTEPLVVASTPGAASEVLQGLTPPPAGTETTVAAANPAATPAVPAVPAELAAQMPPEASSPEAAPPVATTPSTGTAPVDPPPSAPDQPSVPAPVAPTPTPAPTTAAVEPVPAAPATAPTAPATAPAGSALTELQPTIDAIEIEGDRTFFAGSGPEGATTRLYVDDSFIADSTVKDGRWLVEAGKVLTKPSQRIRIDVLQPGSATVTSRAEVNFVVDLPTEEPAVAVAQTEPPATPATSAAPSEPSTTPASPPPAPVADAVPATPAAPETSQPRPDTTTAAPVEPAPAGQPEVPTMVGTSVGDPEAQRFASGKAIIRTGDNLWTIARRVYGAGIKYTTIYEANTGQIRNPDRIYPGQVFALPIE